MKVTDIDLEYVRRGLYKSLPISVLLGFLLFQNSFTNSTQALQTVGAALIRTEVKKNAFKGMLLVFVQVLTNFFDQFHAGAADCTTLAPLFTHMCSLARSTSFADAQRRRWDIGCVYKHIVLFPCCSSEQVSWKSYVCMYICMYIGRERVRKRERERERERERDRQRQTETETERHTHSERDRE
jgi:hypothetical protein